MLLDIGDLISKPFPSFSPADAIFSWVDSHQLVSECGCADSSFDCWRGGRSLWHNLAYTGIKHKQKYILGALQDIPYSILKNICKPLEILENRYLDTNNFLGRRVLRLWVLMRNFKRRVIFSDVPSHLRNPNVSESCGPHPRAQRHEYQVTSPDMVTKKQPIKTDLFFVYINLGEINHRFTNGCAPRLPHLPPIPC